jgi:hypothetical protein
MTLNLLPGSLVQKTLTAILFLIITTSGANSANAFPGDEKDDGSQKKIIEELSTDQVKRFLDPTLMINRLTYDFQMSFLPGDAELMTHKTRPWYAINNSNAIWVEIPYLVYSIPDVNGWSGIGDISVGWGFLIHENLRRRLTTVAAGVDFRLPTGDPAKGTGFDTYLVKPAILIATNPTDLFPVYITGRYGHSFGDEGITVRSFEINVQTFHILPKGFFLAFVPNFVWNMEQDFNIFSIALGAGRALNRRLSLQGAYVQRVAGEETFSRGFTLGFNYLWGKDKSSQ